MRRKERKTIILYNHKQQQLQQLQEKKDWKAIAVPERSKRSLRKGSALVNIYRIANGNNLKSNVLALFVISQIEDLWSSYNFNQV